MKSLFAFLEKMSETVILLIGILQVILLGGIDHLTGYEVSFSIFYLLPVAFAGWFGRRVHAIILAVLSGAVWMWADLSSGHMYSHPAIPVWNSLMRVGFFLLAAFSVSSIKSLLEREQSFARIDALTGIANIRAFTELSRREIGKTERFGRPLTLAYIDVDNFKQVNDTLGHSQGDNLLRAVAGKIKDSIRSIDIVSRLGGDEFAVLFPETDEENVKRAIGKVREQLLRLAQENNWPVTFSIGVVTCYKACHLDELIKEADNLMYAVKGSGKNRIAYKVHQVE